MKIKTLLIKLLTCLRDSRLLWEVMGPVYNRRIHAAIAELYDYIAQAMTLKAKARLLDAGSGRGYISIQIAGQNPQTQVTGIDYSHMQVRAAKKHCGRNRVSNCAFAQGNVINIRFNDKTFDAAVSVGSIKHWPNAIRGLKEIHRVLKPGGLVIISETDQEASDEDIRQFLTRFKVWFVPNRLLFWGLRNVIFGQSFTQTSLADAVRSAGFLHIESLRAPACPYVIVKARKQANRPD